MQIPPPIAIIVVLLILMIQDTQFSLGRSAYPSSFQWSPSNASTFLRLPDGLLPPATIKASLPFSVVNTADEWKRRQEFSDGAYN